MQLADVDIGQVWQFSPAKGGFNSLADLMSFIFPRLLLLGGIIFFVLIVIAGIGVISGAGGGDPHKAEQSKMFLTYAVIGLIIMFGSFWILQIINFVTHGSLNSLIGP